MEVVRTDRGGPVRVCADVDDAMDEATDGGGGGRGADGVGRGGGSFVVRNERVLGLCE